MTVLSPADHPHGRGDGQRRTWSVQLGHGSPPRAWGRPAGIANRPERERITPTGVGTALRRNWRSRSRPDHPHGRGDGAVSANHWMAAFGSPPRAWGRLVSSRCPRGPGRITPTGVGTALRRNWRSRSRPDHPHGRGDGTACPMGGNSAGGSPPRAWGRPDGQIHIQDGDRITPTGVGTAYQKRQNGAEQADHPHGRGDGTMPTIPMPAATGSPPRAWGRQRGPGKRGARRRITPTGVGTATARPGVPARHSDHPHGRGDGTLQDPEDRGEAGSPPRAWGRLRPLGSVVGHERITPTGVGTARRAGRSR